MASGDSKAERLFVSRDIGETGAGRGPPGVRVLISEDEIRRRVAELAARIEKDYAEAGQILMLVVLRGAFIFAADLSRSLALPRQVDFIALSSYGDGTRADGVRLVMDSRVPVSGRHVLVVEDILDTGGTLAYLMRIFAARGPASLRSCVLVRKPGPPDRTAVDYVGFEVPDAWVVGYGLDVGNRYRALPFIGILESPPEASPGT
jgi:hypoxanthine phosphoribosyltransferase